MKSEGEKKWNKLLPDTFHVDRLTGVQLTPIASVKPSPKKSSAKRARMSKEEGFVNLALPSNASAYLDPSFLQTTTNSLLLLVDHKWLSDIGPMQEAERSITR